MQVLCRSVLYTLATTTNLFNPQYTNEGFTPYILVDKGYPLYPWLITPYRDLPQGGVQSVTERLFNCKLKIGRCMVNNAFGILKGVFKELRHVIEIHVTIVPDMVVACCLLHNLLFGQSVDDVAHLLKIIHLDDSE